MCCTFMQTASREDRGRPGTGSKPLTARSARRWESNRASENEAASPSARTPVPRVYFEGDELDVQCEWIVENHTKRLQAASGFLFRSTRSSTWWKWNRKDFEMYAKLQGEEGQTDYSSTASQRQDLRIDSPIRAK
jgi:hypothetical protein